METSPHITIKSDIEHIRLRPGMYIGSTYDPNHLLQEILDNALDELINKYASEIRVYFESDSHVIITDNGRGIPVHEIELENGIKELSIIAASSRLKSGAKFDNDAYGLSIGLHGIGLVAVNALSNFMTIMVKDQNDKSKIHIVRYINSELIEYTVKTLNDELTLNWSTWIEFQPNPTYFTLPNFNKNRVIDQFKLTSGKFPHAQLYVDDNLIKIDSMDDFVREKLELDSSIELINWKLKSTIPVKQYNGNNVELINEPIELDCYFTYELNSSASVVSLGDVNLRLCSGRFLNNFCTVFANIILAKHPELSKNDVLSNFRLYISSFIPNPEFDSQSKTNMSKDIRYIIDNKKQELEVKINTSSYLSSCIENILYRKNLKKAAKKITKTKGRVTAKNPLRDCLDTPGKTLWLLEGDSAMGNLLQIRNPRIEGVFPLTGKILNVVSKNINQVTDSKKFRYLFEALGVDIKNRNQTDFRFEELKILCDADPDGHHIIVLLLMGIWYYFPYFLNSNKLTIIIPPLYGVYDKGKFIPLYSQQSSLKYSNCRRYKGIGEMNATELEVIIRGGGVEYKPTPPKTNDEVEALIRCLNDTELKRRLCLEKDKFNLENLFPNELK